MDSNQKIDKIFSIVSDIKTDVAVIKNNVMHIEDKVKRVEREQFVMDVNIQDLQTKKAEYNIIGKGVMFVVALLSSATGALLAMIINYFIHK